MFPLSTNDLPEGHLVAGRYRVERLIGRGGVGAVYAVTDEQLARKAALKLLLSGHAGDAQLVERFHREARITASIGHPGIVDMYERGEHQGLLYLVMEYLEGENLDTRVTRTGPQAPAFVARVGTDLCSALAAAHARGIVHRDIKPSNVFLAEQGDHYDVVKVLDFGMAKLHQGERLTRSNQVFGTLAYMPPEQLSSSKKVTPASDTYAIGCVLYELLTGGPPFEAASHAMLGLKIMHDPPPPLRSARSDLPAELCAIVERSLRKQPELRYADAGELGDALYAIADRLGALEPPRKRRSMARSGSRRRDLPAERAQVQTLPIAGLHDATAPHGARVNAWSVAESERAAAPRASSAVGASTLGNAEAAKVVVGVALLVMTVTVALAWWLLG